MSGAVRRLVNLSSQLGGQATRILPNHGVMSRVTSSSAPPGSSPKGAFAKVSTAVNLSGLRLITVSIHISHGMGMADGLGTEF